MSDNPVYAAVPASSRSPRPRSTARTVFLVLSLLLNGAFFLLFVGLCAGAYVLRESMSDDTPVSLRERHHSGPTTATDKIAILEFEDLLIETRIDFMERQIEQTAKDDQVKAVVVRIVSPGGSITASDAVHRKLTRLRDGDSEKGYKAKPLVVSMGALAASGGYYIAMPAQAIYAERTTMTGSIGVFASFPNVKELSDKIGLKMEVFKAGAVKTAGSPFHDMKPEERVMWQDMINHAYTQFKTVVEEGRPQLKGKLEDKVIDEPRQITVTDKDNQTKSIDVQFVRQRADGGLFTADKALEFGLVDHIGFLDDALKDAKARAGTGREYEVITYERPRTLFGRLLGVEDKSSPPPANVLDSAHLTAALTPRLWYLAPQSELAGIAAAGGR
jgi:protease-4